MSLHVSVRLGVVLALFAVTAAAALMALGAAGAHAAVTCSRYAGPSGSDSAAGSKDPPLRSAQALVDSLASGETGCLRGGSYDGDVTIAHPGVTLTSYPGEWARIFGRFWVARTGTGSTVANLGLNGSPAHGTNDENLPSPTVNASNVTFRRNIVTNDHHAICFVLGSGWGSADGTVVRNNRIHDCGVLPAQNHHHGIYVEEPTDSQ